MLNFAEELTLLLLDDDTGDLITGITPARNHVMASAVLMDLAYRSKIDVDLQQVVVVDPSPTGDSILDPFLARMAANEGPTGAGEWIDTFSRDGDAILQACKRSLVEKGILKQVDEKVFWVIGVRRYPMIDDKEEREVKLRVFDVLLSDKIPLPRDVVLICLVDAAGLFGILMSDRELAHATGRIAQVTKLDLVGQALAGTLERLRREIQIAAMAHPPM